MISPIIKTPSYPPKNRQLEKISSGLAKKLGELFKLTANSGQRISSAFETSRKCTPRKYLDFFSTKYCDLFDPSCITVSPARTHTDKGRYNHGIAVKMNGNSLVLIMHPKLTKVACPLLDSIIILASELSKEQISYREFLGCCKKVINQHAISCSGHQSEQDSKDKKVCSHLRHLAEKFTLLQTFLIGEQTKIYPEAAQAYKALANLHTYIEHTEV